jgi:hypothetical protein
MNIRQQIIADRVADLVSTLGIPEDEAFERLVHSLITGQSVHGLDPADWVDGSQDKQIDIISIEEGEEEAEIFIISAKFTGGFSSNAIVLMRNGLHWIFNRSRAEIATISNEPFRDKILEIRSVQSGFGPSNIGIHCFFVTNGSAASISNEYQQEIRGVLGEYDNETFAEFSFASLGADELVGLINQIERRNRSIDVDIPIRYDANTPSLIRYHSQGLKGLICTASARDIADVVNRDTSGALFDSNIRRFLGRGRAVNSEILRTASDPASSYLFWFLNNGITVICDSFDAVTDPDKPVVKIRNLQIVNGYQTTTALAHAANEGSLRSDTRVLLRIYEATDPTLNLQWGNYWTSRDLPGNMCRGARLVSNSHTATEYYRNSSEAA